MQLLSSRKCLFEFPIPVDHYIHPQLQPPSKPLPSPSEHALLWIYRILQKAVPFYSFLSLPSSSSRLVASSERATGIIWFVNAHYMCNDCKSSSSSQILTQDEYYYYYRMSQSGRRRKNWHIQWIAINDTPLTESPPITPVLWQLSAVLPAGRHSPGHRAGEESSLEELL